MPDDAAFPPPPSGQADLTIRARPAGRPSAYSAELADEILSRMSEGETVRRIALDADMPAASTIRLWAAKDVEGFADRYARARELQGHAIAEEALDDADQASGDAAAVQAARLRFDAKRWLASKLAPRSYSEKAQIEHLGQFGVVSSEPMTPEEWTAKYGRRDD